MRICVFENLPNGFLHIGQPAAADGFIRHEMERARIDPRRQTKLTQHIHGGVDIATTQRQLRITGAHPFVGTLPAQNIQRFSGRPQVIILKLQIKKREAGERVFRIELQGAAKIGLCSDAISETTFDVAEIAERHRVHRCEPRQFKCGFASFLKGAAVPEPVRQLAPTPVVVRIVFENSAHFSNRFGQAPPLALNPRGAGPKCYGWRFPGGWPASRQRLVPPISPGKGERAKIPGRLTTGIQRNGFVQSGQALLQIFRCVEHLRQTQPGKSLASTSLREVTREVHRKLRLF